MTERDKTIQKYVEAYNRRHFDGRRPTDKEIEGWCDRYTGHLERSIRRATLKAVKASMDRLFAHGTFVGYA